MSSTRRGNSFENSIFELLTSEIDSGRFYVSKANCKLFRRKGYYSRDRKKRIIFDLSIEVSLPGADQYAILVLIECKNYTHSVPVDDIEEFFAKSQQVAAANSKAIVASTAAFQASSLEFARSKGMGLLRYFSTENFKWVLHRSPSASARGTSQEAEEILSAGLVQADFRSKIFDLFLQSPTRSTNSLWEFFDDLVASTSLARADVRRITSARSRQVSLVPFREKGELEALAEEALDGVSYEAGSVSLEAICQRETERTGLVVETGITRPETDEANPPLGRITFDPLRIEVFAYGSPHASRDRFTLAHELAHHLLDHGRFMSREYCDETDFSLQRKRIDEGTDIARFEYQANYFAASMLMPRANFVADFWRLVNALEIRNKGFGPLYVDNQQCNLDSYFAVTGALTARYCVSRIAATIRLEGLGLLRDARTQGMPRFGGARTLSDLEDSRYE